MNKYSTNRHQTQGLNPLQKLLYNKILLNYNRRKAKQEAITRKWLKGLVFYSIDSIANALQELRKLGLIVYSKAKKVWILILSSHDSIDIYDFYIKFKSNNSVYNKKGEVWLE